MSSPLDTIDIGALVQKDEQEQYDLQARSSVAVAAGSDPDRHAEVLNLAKRTGLPSDTVERNMDAVKKREALESLDIAGVINETPEARKWLGDRDNAKLVSDDFSTIGQLKKNLSDLPESFLDSRDTQALIELRNKQMFGTLTPKEQIEADVISSSLERAQRGTGGFLSTGLQGALQNSTQIARTAGAAGVGGVAGYVAGGALGGAAGVLGGPFAEVTVPTGAAYGARWGARLLGTAAAGYENFKQQSGLVFDDLLKIKDAQGNRIDPDVARGAAIAVGSINAGLDLVGLEKMAKTIPGFEKVQAALTRGGIKNAMKVPGMKAAFTRIGKRFATGVAVEGATEAGQEINAIIGEEASKFLSNGEFESASFGQQAERVAEAGVAGAGVATVLGGAGSLASSAIEARRKRSITPDQTAAHVDAIHQAVRESKLFQRSPERFNDLVQNLSPDERFYVNSDAALQAIGSLPPEQQSALFNAVPDLRTELETASASGADVSIRKADYASFIAPYSQADTLRDHIKLDPADMSVAERMAQSEFLQKNPEIAKQIGEQVNQIPPNASAKEMVPAIERIVRKAMRDAGLSVEEARMGASLYARTQARFASAFGQNAIDAINRGLLEFQTVDAQGNPIKTGSNFGVLVSDLNRIRSGERVPGMDDVGRAAVEDFGNRLQQAGISPEQAQALPAKELLNKLYPAKQEDSAPTDLSTLLEQQVEMPNVEMSGAPGQFNIGLSANTDTISGIKMLAGMAANGDTTAHAALNQTALNSLLRLTSGMSTAKIKADFNTGLYGGYVEPSLGVSMSFDEAEREAALASLAKFAQNYNQEQVHVRANPTAEAVDGVYPDGSYNTPYFRIELPNPLSRAEIEKLIADSGLYGLTFNDKYLEAYHVGNPNDTAAFKQGIQSLLTSLGERGGSYQVSPQRLWVYGSGAGAIPFEQIAGDVRTQETGADPTARLIAERYLGGNVAPVDQAKSLTQDQDQLQQQIAAEYEQLPDNDMDNPVTRQAYTELAKEVTEQFRALPIKVGVWKGTTEPYKNSDEMRRDVQDNNHLYIYKTTPETFGPAGSDFTNHPLLNETEFVSQNGERLLVNDLLRAVHDYYAHNLSPTQFGALGEEAAWKNHMATTISPWARWALTSETRGQNSWVNFNKDVYGKSIPLPERPFARQKAALLPLEYSLTGDAAVDAPVNELMGKLGPEGQNGSLSADQRTNAASLSQIERGSITFTKSNDFAERLRSVLVAFTQSKNFSTSAHEFSHWGVALHRMYAELARERVAAGDASPEVRRILEDWVTLKKEVGAESDRFTVEQEEKIASLFEVYMREGHAPSEQLRRIFTRFRDWLVKIYKDVTALGVTLNDDMRGVFDRWLASEDEIANVRSKNGALAEIAAKLGFSPDVAEKIADYVNSATSNAEEKLYRKLTQEQKRRETQAYKDELAKMKETVAGELAQKREYNLISYLKENGFKILEGPETTGISSDIVGGGESALHPDSIADLYGYDSGIDLLRALRNTPDFGRAVDREARNRLMTKYPDMINDGRIEQRAVDAIVNDRVLLALDLMIKELGRAKGDNSRVGMKQFAMAMAQQQVEKMKLSEANYSFRYDAARETEMRKALESSRAGKPNDAMLHLQRAMVNQIIYKNLENFRDMREKAEALFKRVDEKDKDLAPSKDIDFLGAARFILFKYGLGGENFDVNGWIDDIQQRDPDIMQDLIGLSQMVSAPSKAAKDLTISEYRDIYNSIKNIYSTAHNMRELEIAGKRVKTDNAVAELIAQIGPITKPLHDSTQITGVNRFRNGLSSTKAALRRVELWAKAMDAGKAGPFTKYIWQIASDAEDAYKVEREKWMTGFRDILVQHKNMLNERGRIDTEMVKTDALGRTARLTFKNRMELIGFLLHTGNESNLDKLLGGYGIDRDMFARAIKKMELTGVIKKEDWQLVQKLWDYAEALKPIAQRAHKKLYGYRFDEIEHTPVQTEFGTFRGGYWPAIADSDQSANSKSVEQMLEQTRQYMLATTGKGFTKSRVQNYRQPLKTDLRLGSQHIDKVLRFAYLEPATRDIARIINRNDFKEVLKAHDYDALDGMLMPWLQRFSQQTMEAPATAGDRSARIGRRILGFMRSAAISQIIRYNPVVAIQNIANTPIALHLVDKKELAKSFAAVTINPVSMTKEMKASSKMMQERLSTNAVKVSQQIDQIADQSGKFVKFRDFALRHGMIFMHAIDSYLSTVVWHAAYNEHQVAGYNDTESLAHADSIIRQVMGATGSKDVSKIESAHPLMKAIMPFYSYFNAQGNLLGTEFGNIMREHGWAGSPKMFMTYISLVAAPAILGEFITGAIRDRLPDDDDDGEPLLNWLAWATESQLKYLGATVPLAGQGVNAIINVAHGKPADDRLSVSPVISGLSTTARAVQGLAKEASGDDVRDSRLIRDVMAGLGFVTNIPLGQVSKPLSYIVDVEQGETQPDGPLSYIKGLVAGPPPKK